MKRSLFVHEALDVLGSTLATLTPATAGLWACNVLKKAFFTEARWHFSVTPPFFLQSADICFGISVATALDSGLLSFCIEISSVKDCEIGSFNQKQKYTSWSHLLVNSQASGKKKPLLCFFFNRSMFLIHKNSISCQWERVFPGTWLLPIHLPPASLERLPHSRAPLPGAGGGAGVSVRLFCLLLESQWLRAPSLTSRKPSPITSSLSTASSGSFPICPLHLLLCPN